MRQSRFLCLAVSRRDGGNCIAGIDIDSGKWIRPVNAQNHGALWDMETVVKDRRTQKLRMMVPLDLVNLYLNEPAATNGQPENWTLPPASNGDPCPVLCQARDDPSLVARVRNLAGASSSIDLLFGTADNKVPHAAIEKEPIPYSLCVIRPRNLSWVRTTNFHNRPRIEGHFDFGKRNTRYHLPLTDIGWESRLLDWSAGKATLDASESPGMDDSTEIMLTVSLGDHFKETGGHYKLIAGVLLIPRR